LPNLGTFVGSPASGPMVPPASLPPVTFARRAAAQPTDPFERLRQSAARAVDEFFASGGRGQVSASDRLVRAAAASLIAACVDPAHFVRYVCMQSRAKHRKLFPAQVFGPRAVAGWLPEFRSRCASWSSAATYECTPARLREHALRNRWDLLPA